MFVPSYNNGKWGFVDNTRGIVLCPLYDEIGVFSEGLAPVRIFDKWGYINENGELVIGLHFDDAREFVNGTATVSYMGFCCLIKLNDTITTDDKKDSVLSCWLRLVKCLSPATSVGPVFCSQ